MQGPLALQMMIKVQQPLPVILFAGRRFLERLCRRFDHMWEICPRFYQDDRVLNRDLISEIIFWRQPQPLDDVQLIGMKVAVLAEPGIVDEIRGVHYEGVLLPMSYGLSVISGIRPQLVLATIDRDDAIGITRNVFIKKDHLIRELDDFAR